MAPVLWIVSPCYKDGDTVRASVPVMLAKLQSLYDEGLIDRQSRILLVDDGSPDDTWKAVYELCSNNDNVCAIHIKNNSGEEKAYLTGLSFASEYADVVITMDCDLQDDIELCGTMLKHYSDGCDIVIGYRSDRKSDSVLYRNLAGGFYRIMNLFGSQMVPHASQFRLMSAPAVKELLKIPAVHPFLPAMVAGLNMKSCKVPYQRKERIAGSSGYSYGKLFRLAFTVIAEYGKVPRIGNKSDKNSYSLPETDEKYLK